MTPYDMIKAHMTQAIPFAAHVGIELIEIGDGTATAALDQRRETSNHIQTQHAGAMFTLGEAASGAALGGALAPVLLDVRLVASGAQISYVKIAKGRLTATAKTSAPGAELLATLQDVGKVTFSVDVDIHDEAGDTVVTMHVDWHVKTGGQPKS
ncbi:MAG: YiiD C-terminal domain-containing protein [Tateyamaria sp.]|uniref:YiiD C-terminal domain-containing protein n=1 Tax=Tateyamaria sp. TaxID=1929288 RepID=UPI00328458AD